MYQNPLSWQDGHKEEELEEHNEPLVRRGELLFDIDFLSGWSREPRRMNEEKEGAGYRSPASMSMLAAIHVYLLPYRELEGFVRAFSEHVEGLRVPDYTTMWWRISTTKVQLDPGVDPDEDVTITIDSTGIKISNRGEWIRQKWMVKSGFVKSTWRWTREREDTLDAGDEGGRPRPQDIRAASRGGGIIDR